MISFALWLLAIVLTMMWVGGACIGFVIGYRRSEKRHDGASS